MVLRSLGLTPHYTAEDSGTFQGGKDGLMKIPPKYLNIIWGEDERYWKVPKASNTPAELQQVCWLEVTGCVDGTDSKKTYEVGFRLSLAGDAFGWKKYPVYLMVKRGNGKAIWDNKFLYNEASEFDFKKTLGPAEEGNKEAEKGNKEAEKGNEETKIYFGLYEVWSGYWKGGLRIHHALVQEKN